MVGTTAKSKVSARSGILPIVALGAVLAVLTAAGLTYFSGSRPLEALGLPDPGPMTTFGLPVVRTLSEIAAVFTVGGLLLAAFLAPPVGLGYLDVVGYRALRVTSYFAATWSVGALMLVPLTVADSLGRPVTEMLGFTRLIALVPQLDTSAAWALTAVIALGVFAGCRVVLSWGGSVVLWGLAVVGLLPVGATGHSSAGGSHDLATDSLMAHLVAAALWVGGLTALLVLGSNRAEAVSRIPVAVRRFSALAFGCWLVMAASGVVNALVRITWVDLIGSYYGALLLAKTICLLVLGAFGWWQRRAAVDAAVAGRRGSLLKLGSGEVLLMLGTIGLAVALGHSAPPARGVITPTRTAVEIGYDLMGPATPARLAFDWRFALILGSASLLAAVLYATMVRRSGEHWPLVRTVSWVTGCLVVLVATSSGIGRYAPALFSAQLTQCVLLAVLAPALLVAGAPMRLVRRALPPASESAPPSSRELVLGITGGSLARRCTHPAVAPLVLAGGIYAVYLTGLFDLMLLDRSEQLLGQAFFLTAGILFWAGFVRAGLLVRCVLLGAVLLAFGVLGVVVYGSSELGGTFYQGLGLDWVTDRVADQRTGVVVALSIVSATVLAAMVGSFAPARRVESAPAGLAVDGPEGPRPPSSR
jgi:putative copper resistance protein D